MNNVISTRLYFSLDPRGIKVVVGTNQWKFGGTHYEVAATIMHEKHGSIKYAYDIGLIRLKSPIEFNNKVQPIKLSSKVVTPGARLQATGWGRLFVSLL